MNRIVIAGGSGFLGQALAAHFLRAGCEVVVLTRAPSPSGGAAKQVGWDGRSISDWRRELEGATALINLAGQSVNCRYHARNRRLILDSRVDSTRVLGEAINQCANPPAVWLNSSTATIYKHSIDRPMDETGEIGATPEAKDAFSIEVATAWERAFDLAQTSRTRNVALRSAMVVGPYRNSVFPVLQRLVRFGLGGKLGRGRQFVSWIHHVDYCRAVEWLMDHDGLSGAVNLAAPNPLPNAEMMQRLRGLCGMPFGLPAAEWMLECGAFFLRTETELIIKSRRVMPGRLLAVGFQFRFQRIEEAFRDLIQPTFA